MSVEDFYSVASVPRREDGKAAPTEPVDKKPNDIEDADGDTGEGETGESEDSAETYEEEDGDVGFDGHDFGNLFDNLKEYDHGEYDDDDDDDDKNDLPSDEDYGNDEQDDDL